MKKYLFQSKNPVYNTGPWQNEQESTVGHSVEFVIVLSQLPLTNGSFY
jgi:hypothetical protein